MKTIRRPNGPAGNPFKHGHVLGGYATRTYHAWVAMRQRCNNQKHPSYERYGGRGISICKEWSDFAVFLRDMGEAPSGLELDRIDNDGNYEPSNCRWTDRRTQVLNSTTPKMITFNGETMCESDWCRKLGLEASGIKSRRRYGWSEERIFTTPKITEGRNQYSKVQT